MSSALADLKESVSSDPEGSRRTEILLAAQTIFIHYGFRRASLEQIAAEAGISRTGLYHHFRNKEEIFREMGDLVHRLTNDAAELAAGAEGSLADKLLGVLSAKMGWFFDQLSQTRHGNEIVGEGSRLCEDLNVAGARKYQKLIAGLFKKADAAGQVSLRSAGFTADQAATYLTHCAWGLQGHPGVNPPTPAQYRARLQQLVSTTITGMRGSV